MSMHIGILKTDAVRPAWVPTFGEYPDMFEQLFRAVDASLTFSTWDVEQGQQPTALDAADAYVITGSKSSVYDDKPWIRETEALVRRLHGEQRKVVGICFGHQLVAQALGGIVDKSPKGWGVGIHRYALTDDCIGEGAKDFQLIASHQDQVMALPKDAVLTASNEHCPIAGFRIGQHILTFQGHPEFIPEFAQEIIRFRYDLIGTERAEQGLATLQDCQQEGLRIARWILDFIKQP